MKIMQVPGEGGINLGDITESYFDMSNYSVVIACTGAMVSRLPNQKTTKRLPKIVLVPRHLC